MEKNLARVNDFFQNNILFGNKPKGAGPGLTDNAGNAAV
jgi:hypothetical protein